jgi:hypothetical protein
MDGSGGKEAAEIPVPRIFTDPFLPPIPRMVHLRSLPDRRKGPVHARTSLLQPCLWTGINLMIPPSNQPCLAAVPLRFTAAVQ